MKEEKLYKILYCKELSYKARGILMYALYKQDKIKITVEHLVKMSPGGRSSTRSGLSELCNKGYALLISNKDEAGRFTGTFYKFYEEPVF